MNKYHKFFRKKYFTEKEVAAFKMLENKAEVLPLKKHGNIPL